MGVGIKKSNPCVQAVLTGFCRLRGCRPQRSPARPLSAQSAARIMPWLSTPQSTAGFKLADKHHMPADKLLRLVPLGDAGSHRACAGAVVQGSV